MKEFGSSAALLCAILLTPAASFAGSWTEVPGAAPGSNSIYGLVSLSSSDAWAVGGTGSNNTQTLIEHWDGSTWPVVPSPKTAVFSRLYGVAARSPKDVWSVGQGDSQTLVTHWNGMEWIEVPSPNIGQYDSLQAVEVISRNDVWAAGYSLLPDLTYLLMHWDGMTWSLVGGPPVNRSSLSSIKAFASNDVWAVGSKDIDYSSNTASTLTMHWDGTAWSVIPSPNVDLGTISRASTVRRPTIFGQSAIRPAVPI